MLKLGIKINKNRSLLIKLLVGGKYYVEMAENRFILSVLAFFASNSGRIRKCLIEESLPPSKRLTHEEVFNLSKEADSLYKHGLKIVAEKKKTIKILL